MLAKCGEPRTCEDRMQAHVVGAARAQLASAMTTGAGVERSADSLGSVLASIGSTEAWLEANPQVTVSHWELVNLTLVSRVLASAALAREESRGTHWRRDFPETSTDAPVRLVTGDGP